MADNARVGRAPRQITLAVLVVFAGVACAGVEPHRGPTLAESSTEARLLFVGAHPDDETLAGPILAHFCLAKSRPCRIVLLTRGEGGRCDRAQGCGDLAALRTREVTRVASAYGAELVLFDYPNAPLPWSSFPTVPELRQSWRAHGDPVRKLADQIRAFRPTIVFTFDREGGFTRHPEHQLSAALADEAMLLAEDATEVAVHPPHRVGRVYRVLNRYWFPRLVGTADPTVPNETFDTHVSCRPYRGTCLDLALEATKLHESQEEDMALVRSLRPQMGTIYLRLIERSEGGR